jgi:hypothetical protein
MKIEGQALSSDNLFTERRSLASSAAWACVVYSMVPYLGILFLPFGFLISSIGFASAYRSSDDSEMRSAKICLGLSGMILFCQLLLWWLLYLIPETGI